MSWESLVFFWGVWLLIPLVVDISQAVADAFLVWRHRAMAQPYPPLPRVDLPKVSIVIPAYNEQLNIDRCITSLKAQTYPHHLIEVIVIDDGSTDRTEAVVNGHISGNPHWNGHIRLHNRVIEAREFGGVMTLVQGGHKGKPAAVNLGLGRCRGDLIFAIDSDVVLEQEAIEQAVSAFLADPDMMAATAHLIIDHNLLVLADDEGHILLDDDDLPTPQLLNLSERYLSSSQFLEYLQSFRIGRHAEAARGELFTLSGACAMFRKEVLLEMNGYRGRTVSEDTDATLSIQRSKQRVGYLPQVRTHLAPVIRWDELAAQRIRWQRGQLEVMSVNLDMLFTAGRFWSWSLPLRLQTDHALTILRLVWLFLLPLFPLVGYPLSTIAQALMLLYVLYLATDAMEMTVAWPICAPSEKKLLREAAIFLPLLPLYRILVYFFRVGGILRTLSEKPTWTVSGTWFQGLRTPGSQRVKQLAKAFLKVWAD